MRGAVKKKLQYSEVQDEFVLSAKQTDVTTTLLPADLSSNQFIRQEYSFYSTGSRVSFPAKQRCKNVSYRADGCLQSVPVRSTYSDLHFLSSKNSIFFKTHSHTM